MARLNTDDLPPPYYSVAVHTQPPLKSYEEVVYGVAPGPTPANQPHYIPQYAPPVAAPQVTQLSSPPRSRKRGCCKKDAQCYGGSGAAFILIALLAVAVWIGVKYGTRVFTQDLNNFDDDDDQQDVDFDDNQSVLIRDTCPDNATNCDGINDCELGSDEMNCVRLAISNRLEVRTAEDGRFLPVCFNGWDQNIADRTCTQLGFPKSYSYTNITTRDSIGLTLTNSVSESIQSQVEVSSSCPDQSAVSLQCVDCGKQQSTSRIVGGTVAERGQWPWQLTLHFRGSHVCGGVLIAPDFVLTAAHCFPRNNPASLWPQLWKVYAGVTSLDDLTPALAVEKIILNENYDDLTNDQDIALLKLATEVEFNDDIHPACLPLTAQRFRSGTACWTSGFGTTMAGSGVVSNELMEVTVDLISMPECNNPLVYGGAVSNNMICAGHLEGGRDSCQGDSGGPLVCQKDDMWYLVGITSWGAGCAEENKPGVYTRVSRFLPWIYTNMQYLRL
ncbi:transmembrane protease serine 13-like isoform X1 [Syngnathus typhle]|uniref:transmembrane protease serine 13-like isoform X1 n=1 Tax=Syngnathus typhle TaxID=161592 RepID=UPI002A6AA435|nr:transmembrane protease serine 13-like isoform X1 [Syngnathus typhle]XP_061137240.1 transmembrane protease serine 13-like isoform X1 [Syngnathus typhle]